MSKLANGRALFAVAFGFILALATWGEFVLETTLCEAGGKTLQSVAALFSPDIFIYGMLALSQGFLYICVFFSSILAMIIDRRWLARTVAPV